MGLCKQSHYRFGSLVDYRAEEIREATDGGNGKYERNRREAFVPLGIGERLVVLILHCAKEQLTHYTQDVNRGYHNRAASHDGEHTVEHVGMLERTDENRHFGHETTQARQTE